MFMEHICEFEDPGTDEDCMFGFPCIGTMQDPMHLQVMLENRVLFDMFVMFNSSIRC